MKKSTLYASFVFLLMLAMVVTGCSTTETSTTKTEENTAGMEQKEQKTIPKVDEKLVARLHLDDVKNIPSYTVHAYGHLYKPHFQKSEWN